MHSEERRRRPGGGMVQGALQPLPNVLPKKAVSLVARNLARAGDEEEGLTGAALKREAWNSEDCRRIGK